MSTATYRRETVDAKAFRLKSLVRWQSATVATVVGDHGEYRIERAGSDWRCNCRWGLNRTAERKPCSHVLAAALSAPPVGAQPVPVAPISFLPTAVRRQPTDQAIGDCKCRLVNPTELYYNRFQCTVIHRVCGCPWSGRRKSPVRISPVEQTAQLQALLA